MYVTVVKPIVPTADELAWMGTDLIPLRLWLAREQVERHMAPKNDDRTEEPKE